MFAHMNHYEPRLFVLLVRWNHCACDQAPGVWISSDDTDADLMAAETLGIEEVD